MKEAIDEIEQQAIYLTSEELESLGVEDGELTWHAVDGAKVLLHAVCAFPLSWPGKEIVLLDDNDQEIGIIDDLKRLNKEVREVIDQQLERRYFLPQVLEIHNMNERFGSAIWDLETDRGRVEISTRQLNRAIRELTPTRCLIVDVEGNRYEIRDLNKLSPESRAHFMGRG